MLHYITLHQITLHMSGKFAFLAGDLLQLQVDLLAIEIVPAALWRKRFKIQTDRTLESLADLAGVAVVVIFPALAADQSSPAAPAGDDGLLAPHTPGRAVPANISQALPLPLLSV